MNIFPLSVFITLCVLLILPGSRDFTLWIVMSIVLLASLWKAFPTRFVGSFAGEEIGDSFTVLKRQNLPFGFYCLKLKSMKRRDEFWAMFSAQDIVHSGSNGEDLEISIGCVISHTTDSGGPAVAIEEFA